MRILFVGQAPSRETDGQPPFVGKCGKFLADLLGLTQEQMLDQHDFMNCLDYWPGKGIGGDNFPVPEARRQVFKKIEQLRGRTVVLLGANVARAFEAKKWEYGSWYQLRNPKNTNDQVCYLTVVPHPSQRNRTWNNPDTRSSVSQFLRELASK